MQWTLQAVTLAARTFSRFTQGLVPLAVPYPLAAKSQATLARVGQEQAEPCMANQERSNNTETL
jgi:hypothetical protein